MASDRQRVTCWTASDLETQPRVRASGPDLVEVTMIVGVWTEVPFPLELVPRAETQHDGTWRPVAGSAMRWTELTSAELARRDLLSNVPDRAHEWLESTRYLADVRAHLVRRSGDPACYPNNHYFEVVISDLPAGRLLGFVADVVLAGSSVRASSDRAQLWLTAPVFAVGDVVATHTLDDADGPQDDRWWVLMHHRDDEFDHLRLDLLTTQNLTRRPPPASNLAPLIFDLDGQQVDLVATGASTGVDSADFVSVRVDRSTDSVLITRRRGTPELRGVMITTRADGDQAERVPVDLITAARDAHPVAVMIIAYAIQGLNDLFVDPVASYQPPRNFAQIAFSDERALFSGRPETVETTVGDGYRYVLTAQLGYEVKTVWAFNSGALLLLKHSLGATEFAELTQAVRTGLVSVANAGIGAHRNCCYRTETNVQEIVRADELIARILSHQGVPAQRNKIYFPDSRIYQARTGEIESYQVLISRGTVDTIVLDRSTVAHGPADEQQQLYFGAGTPDEREGNHLWRDHRTGLDVLMIEDALRDLLVAGSDDEVPRGQLHYDLRRLFMRSLGQSRGQPRQLFCFGDDIDHLAGNGWFDGNYTNAKAFTHAFLAASCWLSDHPWMRAVVPEDTGFRAEFRRTDRELTLASATDATMDPRGASQQRYPGGPWIHFEDWYRAWHRTTSPWLGSTLGTISDQLEEALVRWPAADRNELYELGWLYFLSCTHESMWSKQPVERGAGNVLDHPFAWEPEDFVISESLQLRNAWVYLNASVWASWAARQPVPGNFVLDPGTLTDPVQSGPLLARLRAAGSAEAWWPNASPTGSGTYWDHDLLANTVLYNSAVLAVLDRNGGRITQLFCRAGGRWVSVSGTNKAYQFLQVGPPQIACDGPRLQNTVFTANHAYLATDVTQAQPRPGRYTDQRNPTGMNPTWLPDNLNAYECRAWVEPATDDGAGPAVVEAAYVQTPAAELPAGTVLSWEDDVAPRCVEDGRRLRAGEPGVVWHDSPGFTKSMSLTGRRLHVRYTGIATGHLVANEFSVDLLELLRGGQAQQREVGSTVATITSAAGLTVTVTLGAGCQFTPDTRLARGPASRVLTEDLRIEATRDGGFDYTIDLPG